jgi:hypothetical protein
MFGRRPRRFASVPVGREASVGAVRTGGTFMGGAVGRSESESRNGSKVLFEVEIR